MAEVHPEIASHSPREGMCTVRLHGGPWDGKEVGVRNPHALLLQVNGPRHGDHRVWITHLYARRGDRYEYQRTDVIPIEFPASFQPRPAAGLRSQDETPARGRA